MSIMSESTEFAAVLYGTKLTYMSKAIDVSINAHFLNIRPVLVTVLF